jgi:hypothetical protein
MHRTPGFTSVVLVLAVMLCGLLSAGQVLAQAVAGSKLAGDVKDSSGGVLPGATVTATNAATGLARTVYTDSEGAYVLPNLPVGPYRLVVTLEGFATYNRDGIVLQVGSSPTVDVTLGVGGIGEQVNVVAAASMVDTRGTAVGQLIEEKQIVNLPLNGRQPTQLILLSGAAVVTTSGNLVGDKRQYPSSVSISVAGGAGNGTAYLVDGGYNNDPLANISQAMPFPDALQEFKVENGVRPARYGILPGATVNAVTKSGTNQVHGDVFEFFRDSRFNAIRPFTTTDDGLSRNQWGGVIGGPIVSNRAFFFGGLQMTRTRINPTNSASFTPTAKMLQGDFTDVASAACNAGKAVTLPAPFVNNRVDPSVFSPMAVKIAKYLPVSTDPCGAITYQIRNDSDEVLGIGKIDVQATSKQRVFARYFIANYQHDPQFDGKNLLLASGDGLGLDNRVQTAVVADDYAISSSLFSSTRFAIAKSRILRMQGGGIFNGQDLGAAMTPLSTEEGFNFLATSVTNGFPANAFPGKFFSTTYQVSQDFDWVKGQHQIAFGGMIVRPKLDVFGPANANGRWTWNGSRAGGGRIGYADFFLGLPSSYTQGGAQDIHQSLNYLAAYVQDTWRPSSHLTINLGLRWEPYLAATDDAGYAANFSLDSFLAKKKSTVYTNAPAGLTFPGDPDFPGNAFNYNTLARFAPRVGLVWDPKGDGTQTIRVAGGIFYESPKMWQYGVYTLNMPFGNIITVNNPLSNENPWATYSGGNPFPVKKPVSKDVVFPQYSVYASNPLDVKPTQVQQWNISYERQFAANWLIAFNYVGNHTVHLWLGRELNPGIYIPGQSTTGNVNQRRYLYLTDPTNGVNFGSINYLDDGATARYNGLVVQLNKRMSKNWSLLSNLTWSKCVNDGDPQLDNGNFYPDPSDRSTNRGACNSDRRFMYNGSLMLQSPGFGSGIAKALSADWQFSTIVQARSGGPLTPSISTNNSLTGLTPQRPIVTGDPIVSSPTSDAWFNTSAFSANTAGVWGTATRGMIIGPAYFNVDVALSRNVTVFGAKLEARVEAFNVFNRTQYDNPIVEYTSTNFGKVITAMDPRILQFAVKVVF